MTAEICREVGSGPLTPAARAAACAPVRRAVVASGRSDLIDPLPNPLQTGPAVLLTYRLKLYNASGRSAGESAPAFAAGGAAPAAVADLHATASEGGAVIEWRASPAEGDHIDLLRTDLSAPPAPVEKAKPHASRPVTRGKTSAAPKGRPEAQTGAQTRAQTTTLHLLAADTPPDGHGETAGTIDATAAMGSMYTYTAERVRSVTLAGHPLELHGMPSATVTLAMRDTFAPKPPTGLATVSGFARPDAAGEAAPYIDLSWEPNGEPDLAGYLVYRQLARPNGDPQGPIARLTPLPIPAPSYRDVAVRPGQRYSYHVTAVDASGNESAPSAKALESVKNQETIASPP
jgi:hypothetical protein